MDEPVDLAATLSDKQLCRAASATVCLPLPDEPHQPKGYNFPKREFGQKNPVRRAFQSSWFSKWPWIHYDEALDSAFCFTCARAEEQGKLRSGSRDLSFLSKGFSNWKDGTESFKRHEKSKCHIEAVG